MRRRQQAMAESWTDGIRTHDGRYLVVRDRLWRATNPALPEEERQQLVSRLMRARREIAAARRQGDAAAVQRARRRRRLDRIKVALGERGPVWWTDGAADENRRMVRNTPYAEWFQRTEAMTDTIERLLRARAPGTSICPSEAARAFEPRAWRDHLDEVRAIARHLARQGHVVVTQRGRRLEPDQPWRGPVRLRLP
jgi:hypothetical protein